MTEEYEEPDYTEEEANKNGLPAGVVERLTKYAERIKKDYTEVEEQYLAYIAKEYLCEDPSQEDEDLLVDWAEQLVIETRNVTSGGGTYGGIKYAGLLVWSQTHVTVERT